MLKRHINLPNRIGQKAYRKLRRAPRLKHPRTWYARDRAAAERAAISTLAA